jgi:hypothetical protein
VNSSAARAATLDDLGRVELALLVSGRADPGVLGEAGGGFGSAGAREQAGNAARSAAAALQRS